MVPGQGLRVQVQEVQQLVIQVLADLLLLSIDVPLNSIPCLASCGEGETAAQHQLQDEAEKLGSPQSSFFLFVVLKPISVKAVIAGSLVFFPPTVILYQGHFSIRHLNRWKPAVSKIDRKPFSTCREILDFSSNGTSFSDSLVAA